MILHELVTENCDVAIGPKIQGLYDFSFLSVEKEDGCGYVFEKGSKV